jgi:hypothetical protein
MDRLSDALARLEASQPCPDVELVVRWCKQARRYLQVLEGSARDLAAGPLSVPEGADS